MKQILKKLLVLLHVSVTRNQKYDAYTRKILSRSLKPNSNCIDIGCHKGEILDLMIKSAPLGRKFGFEPLPGLFRFLTEKYQSDPTVKIDATALYDKAGKTHFQFVKNAPAYSGIKRRKYDAKKVQIEQISVNTGLLDEILPPGFCPDLIKIDVEGAEYQVMKGSVETLKRCKPVVVFEFGLGAADFYQSTPDQLHHFITVECGMKISTLKGFLEGRPSLTREIFRDFFEQGREYYFVAHR